MQDYDVESPPYEIKDLADSRLVMPKGPLKASATTDKPRNLHVEKTILVALIAVVGLSFAAAYAHHSDYRGKELNADGLYIKFSNDVDLGLDSHNPIIEEGYIVGIPLTDVPVRSHGNSFVITMPSEGWYVVGTKTKGGYYSVRLNEWDGAKFLKTEFTATLQDTKSAVQQTPPAETNTVPSPTAPKTELIVLVEQGLRNYWKDNYNIDVRVFDKKLNPNPKFIDTLGALKDANVTVTLTPQDGGSKDVLSGQTSNIGIWNGNYLIPDNKKIGKYLVTVDVDYKGSKTSQTLEMFILGRR